MYDKTKIIDKPVKEAQEYLESIDMILRTISLDGKPRFVTCDARENRLNVHIVNDIVTDIQGIG